jgi:hypothetical protein
MRFPLWSLPVWGNPAPPSAQNLSWNLFWQPFHVIATFCMPSEGKSQFAAIQKAQNRAVFASFRPKAVISQKTAGFWPAVFLNYYEIGLAHFSAIDGIAAEFFLDAEELIVFRHAVSAPERTCF